MHSAHTQNSGRAHTARVVPRSWALLRAQQSGHAHIVSAARAGRALNVCRSCACWACTGSDTPRQFAPGRDLKPRLRHPISTGQVATSNRCRDQPLLFPHKRPCRDTKPPQGSQNPVATSNRCRDTIQANPGHDLKTGSRHRFSCLAPNQVATSFFHFFFQVVTSWTTKPGRDANPMSRPPFRPYHTNQVATSKRGCDFISQQARSRRRFHVVTSFPS